MFFSAGYSPHNNYGVFAQSEYATNNSYSTYGPIAAAVAAYQSGNANSTTALSAPISIGSTNHSAVGNLNSHTNSIIGSSNGYSNVSSSGCITSIPSCYAMSSSQHLQADKNCLKDKLVLISFFITVQKLSDRLNLKT